MMKPTYQDVLAYYGIGGAHPGGLALTKKILKNEKIKKSTKILDIGCGTGQTSAYLGKTYGCKIAALDHHPVMVEKAKQRFNKENLSIKLVKGSSEKIPFPKDTFDIVLAESVTVFTNISKSLKEYYRVLKPGGVLLDLDMTAERQFDSDEKADMKRVYGVKRVLTEDEWHREMRKAGFKSSKVIVSGTILSKLLQNPLNREAMPEYNKSKNIDPRLEEILHEHHKLSLFYSTKLGYRYYRSIK